MFKSQLITYWKNLDIKCMSDVYGPEVTGNTQSRRVSGAPGRRMTSGQSKTR